MKITKRSGEKVTYIAKKLRKSLMRSGASGKVVKDIMKAIEDSLYPGIPTQEIYKKAFSLLRKAHRATAAKYKLRNAILELGPSGFPFERYVSHLLESEGYTTEVGVIMKGECVNHEVDIVAKKEKIVNYYECKFRNKATFSCNIKIPLYIHSRFLDLESKRIKDGLHLDSNYECWIVTNTKFTSDATTYALCRGIQLISWNYPPNNGIRERIDKTGMHPITCLTTLTKKEKHNLLSNEVILCRHIMDDPKPLEGIGINPKRLPQIMGEAKALYQLK
jgi:hypothetical protein